MSEEIKTDPTPPTPEVKKVEMTQEEFDAKFNSSFGKGATKATNDLLLDLGVADLDVLKSLVVTEKEREEASKSEVQKLTDLLETERNANATLETKFEQMQTETEIQNIAMANGINPEKIKYFKMDYLDAKDGENFELDKFMGALKEKQPDFFGFIDERPRPNVPNPPSRGASVTQIKMSEYVQLSAADRKKYKSTDIIR